MCVWFALFVTCESMFNTFAWRAETMTTNLMKRKYKRTPQGATSHSQYLNTSAITLNYKHEIFGEYKKITLLFIFQRCADYILMPFDIQYHTLSQVLFACVVAAASAQLVAYPNGAVAPAKTPEVQAAEAAHFAAKGLPWGAYGAYGLGHLGYAGHLGYGAGYAGHLGYAAGYGYAGYPGYAGYGYAGYPWGLVAHANGAVVPAEPADVVAARAAHLAAHGAPLVGPAGPIAPYYAEGVEGLVAHPNGALVPAEPADVVAARAEHLAAHA